MSVPRWLVAVDVAPARTQARVRRTLLDLGFEETLPFVFVDRWTPPERRELIRALRGAYRGGAGRILVARLAARSPPVVIPERGSRAPAGGRVRR